MKIDFILNGEDEVIRSGRDQRLTDILRNSFNLHGTKANCCSGTCGLCSVIFNGHVVKSCLIPAFKISGSEIITIEGFSQTNEYQDIVRGFSEAEADNCGYCNSGKILTTEALLAKNPRPDRHDILLAFNGIKCRCTDPEHIIQGVLAAADIRQRKLYGNRT